MRVSAPGPGGRADRQLAGLLPQPARPGRTAAGRGAHQGQERPGETPVRRAAPPPGPGARPGRRPGSGLPRRAHDRVRPGVATTLLVGDREPPRARQDDLAHHPLPRRGGASRRPGRHLAGRPHPGRRHGATRRPPGRSKDEDQIHRSAAGGRWHSRSSRVPRSRGQRRARGLPDGELRDGAARTAQLGRRERPRRP